MNNFLKLISKYSIILIFMIFFGHYIFLFKINIYPIYSISDTDLWNIFLNFSGYFFQIIVAILLFIDAKKYRLNFYFIPLAGLIYPLLGICVFFILFIYNEIKMSNKDLSVY